MRGLRHLGLLAAFALGSTLYAAAEPLILVTTASTEPFSYYDKETGEIVGTEIDIAREAAAALGRTLEVRILSFPELLPAVADGRADIAASGITITPGRRKTVDFTIPYTTEGGIFLYKSKDRMPSMGNIRMMKELKIGTMDASTYDFFLTSHGVDPLRYEFYDDAVRDLKAGKLDTVFYDSCTVHITAAQSNGEFAFSRLETREPFGFAVEKGNEALREALNAQITARRLK